MPLDHTKGCPQRIAIVGGGISGLASAWLLSRHHKVTLYEGEPRLGGHARTVLAGKEGDQPVDTGFIVFNHVNYPHLTAMFRDLDVPLAKSDMSFGVSLDGGRVEYALRSGNALYGQRRNIFDPRFHLMIRDILRFNAGAEAEVATAPELTLEALIAHMGLGARFRDHYLYPFCGAIWSTPDHDIGAFPARALVRFMRNHGLLSRGEHHQWWTVDGGSVRYVDRLVAALAKAGVDLRPATRVRTVARSGGSVTLRGERAQHVHPPRLMGHNRFGIVAFHDADHGGPRGAGSGAVWAWQQFIEVGIACRPGLVLALLTQPRFLGYWFNPVSFWMLIEDDALIAVIAEVNNTFGQRHSYLLARPDFSPITAQTELTARKVFHVSPFQEVAGQYHFRFALHPDRIAIRIAQEDECAGIDTSMTGPLSPLTTGEILAITLRRPGGALRVIAQIYWHALRLKLKGATYRRLPDPPDQEIS